MNSVSEVKKLTYMALLAAVALVLTFLVKIPVPSTQGYFHPGDIVLVFGVLFIGKKNGSIAGALGQALADLVGGFAIFAPVTFAAKFLMGMTAGKGLEKVELYKKDRKRGHIAGACFWFVLSALIIAGAYYGAESLIFGSWIIPLAEIPVNILQLVIGLVVGALCYRSVKKRRR